MVETEHKSFFRTHKVVAFLPLVLMGAGVWYFVHGRLPAPSGESAAPAPAASAEPEAPRKPGAVPLPAPYNPDAGMDIQGSDEFKNHVTHALKLVWMADRETFLFIKKNLSVIRNENKTGYYAESGRTVAALSSEQAFRSMTWCAGVIAHQAWHARYELGSRKRSRRAPPLPGEPDARMPEANPVKVDYKGLEEVLAGEARAFDFQLDVLRKIGAPRAETDQVLRRAPRDFTAAHDGSYALNP
jgi:hypothetical protein